MQRFQTNFLFSVLFQKDFQNKNLQTNPPSFNAQKQKQNQGNNTSIKLISQIFNFGNFSYLRTLGATIISLVFFVVLAASNAQASNLISSGPTIVISEDASVNAATVADDTKNPNDKQNINQKLKAKSWKLKAIRFDAVARAVIILQAWSADGLEGLLALDNLARTNVANFGHKVLESARGNHQLMKKTFEFISLDVRLVGKKISYSLPTIKYQLTNFDLITITQKDIKQKLGRVGESTRILASHSRTSKKQLIPFCTAIKPIDLRSWKKLHCYLVSDFRRLNDFLGSGKILKQTDNLLANFVSAMGESMVENKKLAELAVNSFGQEILRAPLFVHSKLNLDKLIGNFEAIGVSLKRDLVNAGNIKLAKFKPPHLGLIAKVRGKLNFSKIKLVIEKTARSLAGDSEAAAVKTKIKPAKEKEIVETPFVQSAEKGEWREYIKTLEDGLKVKVKIVQTHLAIAEERLEDFSEKDFFGGAVVKTKNLRKSFYAIIRDEYANFRKNLAQTGRGFAPGAANLVLKTIPNDAGRAFQFLADAAINLGEQTKDIAAASPFWADELWYESKIKILIVKEKIIQNVGNVKNYYYVLATELQSVPRRVVLTGQKMNQAVMNTAWPKLDLVASVQTSVAEMLHQSLAVNEHILASNKSNLLKNQLKPLCLAKKPLDLRIWKQLDCYFVADLNRLRHSFDGKKMTDFDLIAYGQKNIIALGHKLAGDTIGLGQSMSKIFDIVMAVGKETRENTIIQKNGRALAKDSEAAVKTKIKPAKEKEIVETPFVQSAEKGEWREYIKTLEDGLRVKVKIVQTHLAAVFDGEAASETITDDEKLKVKIQNKINFDNIIPEIVSDEYKNFIDNLMLFSRSIASRTNVLIAKVAAVKNVVATNALETKNKVLAFLNFDTRQNTSSTFGSLPQAGTKDKKVTPPAAPLPSIITKTVEKIISEPAVSLAKILETAQNTYLDFKKGLRISEALFVAGPVNIADQFYFDPLIGTLTVPQGKIETKNLRASGVVDFSGATVVGLPQSSGGGFSNNTYYITSAAGNSSEVLSKLTVHGATNLESTLNVTGGASFASTLGVTGATTLSGALTVTGATTFGDITIGGTCVGCGGGSAAVSGTLTSGQITATSSVTSTFVGGISLAASTGGLYIKSNRDWPQIQFSSTGTFLAAPIDTSTGAAAFVFNTTGTLSNAKILSFQTANSEKAYIDANGGIYGASSTFGGVTTVNNLTVVGTCVGCGASVSSSFTTGHLIVTTSSATSTFAGGGIAVSGTTTLYGPVFIGNSLSIARSSANTSGTFYIDSSGNISTSGSFIIPNVFVVDTSGNLTTSGTLRVQSTGSSTLLGGLQSTVLNITSNSATSTFANGIQLSGGCFRDISGNCFQASSYANTLLSNLDANVTINTSLVSDTNNNDDLGTGSKSWKDVFASGTVYVGTSILPRANNVVDIGGFSNAFRYIYVSSSIITGNGAGSSTISSGGSITLSGLLSVGNSIMVGKSDTRASGTFYIDSSGNISNSGTLVTFGAFQIPTVFVIDTSGNLTTSGTLRVQSASTSTVRNGFNIGALNITSTTVTSTFANGIILNGGCILDPSGACLTAAGTGANTALSNLSGVSINASLVAESGNTLDLGTQGTKWRHLFIGSSINASGTILANAFTLGKSTINASGTLYIDSSGNISTSGTIIIPTVFVLDTSGNLTTSGTLRIQNTGTSTFFGGINVGTINQTSSTATSTFSNGIQLSSGCFRDYAGACITAAGTGANTSLSNLASVAINLSLLASIDNTIDIGEQGNRWRHIFVSNSVNSSNTILSENSFAIAKTNTRTSGTFYIDSSGNISTSGTFQIPTVFVVDTSGNITTSGTLRIQSTGTSTVRNGFNIGALNITSTTVTSTFANGIILNGGCILDPAGACLTAAGTGANTALSNLSGVAINASLVANSDNALDLGTQATRWRHLYISNTVNSSGTILSQNSFAINKTTANASGTFYVDSGGNLSVSGTVLLFGQLQSSSTVTSTFSNGIKLSGGCFQSVDGSCAGSTGANTALSNLANTTINTSLISDTNNTDDLGSADKSWKDIFASSTIYVGTSILSRANNIADLGGFGAAFNDIFASGTTYGNIGHLANSFAIGKTNLNASGTFYIDSSGNLSTSGTILVQSIGTSTLLGGLIASQLNINGTAGTSTFANGIRLTGGCILDPAGACLTAAGAGANTALSNLASVAINTTLVSDTDATDDLGTVAIRWRNIFLSGNLSTSSTATFGTAGTLNATNTIYHGLSIGNRTGFLGGSLTIDPSGNVRSSGTLDAGFAIALGRSVSSTQASGTLYIDSGGNISTSGSITIPNVLVINTSGDITSSGTIRLQSANTSTFRGGLQINGAGGLASVNGLTISGGGVILPTTSIADAALSTNVVLIDSVQTVSGFKTFSGATLFTGAFNVSSTAAFGTSLSFNKSSTTASGTLYISSEGNLSTSGSIIIPNVFVLDTSGNLTASGTLRLQSTNTSTLTGGLIASQLNINGTAGSSTFANGIRLTGGCFLLADGTCAGAGSGANTALSNLASVAINTTLVSDTDDTDDLGTVAIRWRNIFLSGNLSTSSTAALGVAGTLGVTSTIYHDLVLGVRAGFLQGGLTLGSSGAISTSGTIFGNGINNILSLNRNSLQASGTFYVDRSGSLSTSGSLFLFGSFQSTSTVTSTFANGIKINGGCFLDATGACLTASGGGANTALSNLASVAINTSLLSDADNTDDLGSNTLRWRNVYAVDVNASSSVSIGNNLTINKTATNASGTFYIESAGHLSSSGSIKIFGPLTVATSSAIAATSTFQGPVDFQDSIEIGQMEFPEDAGEISWVNLPVTTSSPSSTVHSYSARVDNTNVLTVWAMSDGQGSAIDPRVGIGIPNTTTTPRASLDVQGILGLYAVSGTFGGRLTTGEIRVTSTVGISYLSPTYFALYSNSTNASGTFYIDSGGNVISSGTLAVFSTSTGSSFFLGKLALGQRANANEFLTVRGNGAFGDGTTTSTIEPTRFVFASSTSNQLGLFNLDSLGNINSSGTLSIATAFKLGRTGSIASGTLYIDSGGNLFSSGTFQFAGEGGAVTSSLFWDGINGGRLGIGTSTPWATLTVASLGGNNNRLERPIFLVATSTDIGATPLLFVTATTTGAMDFARVGVGTSTTFGDAASSTGNAGLRDQFTVAGRIYQTWRYTSCDFPGINLSQDTGNTGIIATDLDNACGDFSFDEEAANNATLSKQNTSSSPPFIRLEVNDATTDEQAALTTNSYSITASSSPVFEAWARVPSANLEAFPAAKAFYMIGFISASSTVSRLDYVRHPDDGVYFYAGHVGGNGNWKAVASVRSNPGGPTRRTIWDTNFAVSTNPFRKMRIELTSSTATFLIDGNVVALLTTTTPSKSMKAVASVAIQNAGAGTIPKNLDISLLRLWMDDPPSGGGSEAPVGSSFSSLSTESSDYDYSSSLGLYYKVKNKDEKYPPGTLMVLDQSEDSDEPFLKPSDQAYQDTVVGVVVDNPKETIGRRTGSLPIAFTGRTKVKVSSENGPIKVGDYLTASSKKGLAMRATKAGLVIGQALNSAVTSTSEGEVIVILKPSSYLGVQNTETLDTKILARLLLDRVTSLTSVSSTLSEISTDRITAGLDVITSKVVTGELITNLIGSNGGTGLTLDLANNQTFTIAATDTASNKNTIFTIDQRGNAIFSGEVNAMKINAAEISGLNLINEKISNLEQAVSNLEELKNLGHKLFSQDAQFAGNLGASGTIIVAGNIFASGTLYFGDGTPTTSTFLHNLAASGTITASCGSVCSGLSEQMNSTDEVEPGDVMVSGGSSSTLKSKQAYANNIIGVVGDKSSITIFDNGQVVIGGGGGEAKKPIIALAGRVAIKVNNQSGRVMAGDLLVSSNEPGVAMRYDAVLAKQAGVESAAIIAIALEDMPFDAEKAKINAFIRSGYKQANLTIVEKNNGQLAQVATQDFDLGGFSILNIKSLQGLLGKWSMSEDGSLVAGEVKAEKITVTVTDKTQSVGTAKLLAGQATVTVQNSLVKPDTKLFITWKQNPGSSWWVSRQEDGWFEISLEKPATIDASFDYLVISVKNEQTPHPISPEPPPSEEPPSAPAPQLEAGPPPAEEPPPPSESSEPPPQ